MTERPAHYRLLLLTGGQECLDRECEDYFTDDGEPDPGVDRCSHIREELACASCSDGPNADGEYDRVVSWDACTARASA